MKTFNKTSRYFTAKIKTSSKPGAFPCRIHLEFIISHNDKNQWPRICEYQLSMFHKIANKFLGLGFLGYFCLPF